MVSRGGAFQRVGEVLKKTDHTQATEDSRSLTQSLERTIRVKERQCLDCGETFPAEVVVINGTGGEREFAPSRCPTCWEKHDREMAQREKAELEQERAEMKERWHRTCGIQPLFQVKNFDNFERKLQPRAFKAAMDFAENFPLNGAFGYPSLILYSLPGASDHPERGVGLGKTHLASSIAYRIIERWEGDPSDACPVTFVTETDMLLRIRATYNLREWEKQWHEREEEVYRELKSRHLLILDDVGKEQPIDPRFVQRVYFQVIDGRYTRGLPLLITANIGPQRLHDHIGQWAADRLVEMTDGKILELRGESYRRRGRART